MNHHMLFISSARRGLISKPPSSRALLRYTTGTGESQGNNESLFRFNRGRSNRGDGYEKNKDENKDGQSGSRNGSSGVHYTKNLKRSKAPTFRNLRIRKCLETTFVEHVLSRDAYLCASHVYLSSVEVRGNTVRYGLDFHQPATGGGLDEARKVEKYVNGRAFKAKVKSNIFNYFSGFYNACKIKNVSFHFPSKELAFVPRSPTSAADTSDILYDQIVSDTSNAGIDTDGNIDWDRIDCS